MCGSEVLGDDQIEALAERLFRRKAEQRGTGVIPANDLALVVGADQSVSDLIKYFFSQFGLRFHGSTFRSGGQVLSPVKGIASMRMNRPVEAALL